MLQPVKPVGSGIVCHFLPFQWLVNREELQAARSVLPTAQAFAAPEADTDRICIDCG